MTEHLRKPEWLKIRLGGNEQFTRTKSIVEHHCLHTICTSGKCPNMALLTSNAEMIADINRVFAVLEGKQTEPTFKHLLVARFNMVPELIRMAYTSGGKVEPANTREYGRANLTFIDNQDPLLKGISIGSQIWMSHGDTITMLPENFKIIASTDDVKAAAYHGRNRRIAYNHRPFHF